MAKGPYVPLSVSYRESDKMLGVEPLAELLFVRSLAFAKEKFRDGDFTSRQARLLAHDLHMSYNVDPDDLVKQLVDVGLWHEIEGGYLIDGWDDWNTIEASRAGSYGNHKRWHLDRGKVVDDCPHCQTDRPESPPTRPDDLSPRIGGDSQSSSPPIAISTGQISTDREQPKPKRRTRVPDPFEVTDSLREWAAGKSLSVDLDRETEKFVNYHASKGTLNLSWDGAWRNWMLKAEEFASSRNGTQRPADTFDVESWAT